MSQHERRTLLSRTPFTRGQLRTLEMREVLRLYADHDVPPEVRFARHRARHGRLITDVVGSIADGKEATVYQCTAAPELDCEFVAVKVYRAERFRAFHAHAVYRAGETIVDRRMARAVRKGTRAGHLLGHHEWVEREWAHLCMLDQAGAHVPEPLACSPDSIAMEYLGDAEQPAPRLHHVALDGEAAHDALESILSDIEVFLWCDRVHGDLSAYNVLYFEGRAVVIDLPQMVDAAHNPNAASLLARDVANVCRYFERRGLPNRSDEIATALWDRYVRGEL